MNVFTSVCMCPHVAHCEGSSGSAEWLTAEHVCNLVGQMLVDTFADVKCF